MASIEVEALSKSYRAQRRWRDMFLSPFVHRRIEALVDVSFSVGPAELVVLLGPNGAGKSTLLKILSGLVLPGKGLARVDGLDVVEHSLEVRRRIGFVLPEERSFYWRLDGFENLRFFAALCDLHGAGAESKIRELQELLGLDEYMKRPFRQYSSGLRQRLVVARALLSDPPVLLMDEATRSLDPCSGADLRAFVRNRLVIGQKKTVLYATHNLAEAWELADRIIVLDRGRIVARGRPDELEKRFFPGFSHRIVVRIPDDGARRLSCALDDLDIEYSLDSSAGTSTPDGARARPEKVSCQARLAFRVSGEGDMQKALARIVERGIAVVSAGPAGPALDEIFKRMVNEGDS